MTRFIEINTRTIAVDAIVMIDQPNSARNGEIVLTQGKSVLISDDQWAKLKDFLAGDCTCFD